MFSGFPEAGLNFLQTLSENNNREWFEAHKDEYVQYLQTPAVAFIETLGEKLQTISPDIRYDTRLNGSGSLMRIYRDVRFSKDKSPYKTELAVLFPHGEGKKMETPAYGFRIHLMEGAQLFGGVFQFTKPMLEAYRAAVLDDKLGEALIKTAASLPPDYQLGDQSLKRVPRGYDAEHPRADWLRYTGLYAMPPSMTLDVVRTAELVDLCVDHCRRLSPLVAWLVNLPPA